MTLFFRAYRSTLKSQDGKNKWFPRIVKTGKPVSTYQLAEEVAEKSSLTPGDTMNVVYGLINVIGRHLMDGKSVVLDRLGTFTVMSKSGGNGVDTEEEVNADQIHGLKIRFTPSYTRNNIEGKTRTLFSNIELRRLDAIAKSSSEGDGSGSDEGGGDYVDPTV